MKRRKFIVGIGSITAGSIAAIGTAAFTTDEGDRDITVNVANDASRYLSIHHTGGDADMNHISVGQTNNGGVFINVTDNSNNRSGGNPNVVTTLDNVLALRNKGTQDVGVWIEKSDNLDGGLLLYPSNRSGSKLMEGRDNALTLSVGNGPMKIGIKVDTSKTDGDKISGTITFHADTDAPNDE